MAKSEELLREALTAELKKAADWYKTQYRLGDKSEDIRDWRTFKIKEVMNSRFNLGGSTVADFNSTKIVQAIDNGLEPMGDWRSDIVGRRDGITVYKERPYGEQEKVSGYANQDFNFVTLFGEPVKVEAGESICVYMPVGGFGVLRAVPASGKHPLYRFEKVIGHDEFSKLVTSKPSRKTLATRQKTARNRRRKGSGIRRATTPSGLRGLRG